MLSPADKEIRLGIWRIHILHHAESRDVWGRWLLEELRAHGHELSPGTLYPALLRMETNGWLKRTHAASHVRARQTFRITAEGKRLLKVLRQEVTELYEEVVLGEHPALDPVGGGRSRDRLQPIKRKKNVRKPSARRRS